MKRLALCALFICVMYGQGETVSVLSVFMDKVWECMDQQPYNGFADGTLSSVDVLKYAMQNERYFKDRVNLFFMYFNLKTLFT